jgi:hypothetical protein
MTDMSLPAGRLAQGEFRIGRVLSRAWSVLSRNFPVFFAVTALAAAPQAATNTIGDPFRLVTLGDFQLEGFGTFFGMVLGMLSQAVVLYGAFQDMRGKPVSLGESMRVGLRRFLPVVGVAISVTLLGIIGFILFVVPGLMCFTMCFVAMSACVVEKRGVFSSIGRSAQLTLGSGWRIFGIILLWYVTDAIADSVIDPLNAFAGGMPAFVAHVIWSGVWGAFYAICAVVAYHDLRVAKEGVDTEQIAAVFE